MYKSNNLNFIILLLLLCSLCFSMQISETKSATATAQTTGYFPRELNCSFQEVVANGPTWEGITIGKSSLSELKAKLSELAYENTYINDDSFMFIAEHEPQLNFPLTISGCLQNNVVSALKLAEIAQGVAQKDWIFLTNYTPLYGRPDAVTWTTNPMIRIVFWFRKGLAITVYSSSDGGNFARVWDIIYFPYSNNTHYQTVWPYNQTRPEGFENADYPVDPVEQNPFDFETIEATLTAQPSLTPLGTAVK